MLRIRMRRPGKAAKGKYHFKIVVIERSAARDGKFLEQLGYYDPSRELLSFNCEKYDKWVKKGAKPTETVASLFKRYKKANKSA